MDYNGCGYSHQTQNNIEKHHNYFFAPSTTIIPNSQKRIANPNPEIIKSNLSNLNSGRTQGTTTEISEMCPQLINIPETTFICSEDNTSSINYYDIRFNNPVKFCGDNPIITNH